MANEGTDPPLEMCENGQDPHVHKPHCCAHESMADILSRITIHPVKLPGNDFYSVIAEDMAAPLVEALAAAGLLRDQPAETWTEYAVERAPFAGRVKYDKSPARDSALRSVRYLAQYCKEDAHAVQRTVSAGPWRPVEDRVNEINETGGSDG